MTKAGQPTGKSALCFRVVPCRSISRGNNGVNGIRTGVYYTDQADKAVIEQAFAEQEKQLGQKIAVELEPLRHYVPS